MPRNYSSDRPQAPVRALIQPLRSGGLSELDHCDETPFDEKKVIGQIAHIVASSVSGPRGDPDFPAERIDDESNLILLCPSHHVLVDAQPATYTVAVLRGWKREHQRRWAALLTERTLARSTVPLQVPSAPGAFVNRAEDLAALDRLTSEGDPGGAAVVVLTGAHGVGKTALTRYWAHRNRERFTDGQLHVDLGELRHRGGVAVSDVLGDLLRAVDVPEELIPAGLERRATEFRSRTHNRRLLDRARRRRAGGRGHPAAALCARERRAGHRPRTAARADPAAGSTMRLQRLDKASASALLESMIGTSRVAAEPEAVQQLVRFCDGLPVALRICGARLVVNDLALCRG